MKGPDPLPTYVVFFNRKKRHEETLNQYYQAITLGTLDASSSPKALKQGAITFCQRQIDIDVVSLARAPFFQKQLIERRQKEAQPSVQRRTRTTTRRTVSRPS